VAALHGAVALKEVNCAAVGVRKHLHLRLHGRGWGRKSTDGGSQPAQLPTQKHRHLLTPTTRTSM
jgi:hypothetical protein